jgi:BioD-like phosphotransacetylase family protein
MTMPFLQKPLLFVTVSVNTPSVMEDLQAPIPSFKQGTFKTSDFFFRVVTKPMNILAAAGSFFPAMHETDGSKIHKVHYRLSLTF